MVILTQDPSFNALAFCIYDGKRSVYIDKCSYSLGNNIGFEKVFNACVTLGNDYINKVDEILNSEHLEIDEIFSEIAPPVSQFSPGLFALDTYIIYSLWKQYPSVKTTYSIPPSYVKSLRGSSNKSDSTKLAKYYINEVLKDDIEVIIGDTISEKGRRMKGVMNNDKAEAFLFMLRAFCKYDILGTRNKIINEISNFNDEVERTLITR